MQLAKVLHKNTFQFIEDRTCEDYPIGHWEGGRPIVKGGIGRRQPTIQRREESNLSLPVHFWPSLIFFPKQTDRPVFDPIVPEKLKLAASNIHICLRKGPIIRSLIKFCVILYLPCGDNGISFE